MNSRNAVIFSLFFAGSICAASILRAGTGRVRFGAYTAGQGCSGTGICQTGAAGVSVDCSFYQNPDTAGGRYTRLTMVFNYPTAVSNGFIGMPSGGAYMFSGGYTFNHQTDQGMGVPPTYSIPPDYEGVYTPKDEQGNITLTVHQFTKRK